MLPVVTLLALVATACGQTQAAPPAAPPPPQVAVVTVAAESLPLSREWIATLDGFVNAQIRPQVSGYLVRRNYQEGGSVRRGQVLFEIDPRPFQAALEQAQARLGEAQAQLGKAERDLARDKPLAAERAIAQSQLDNDVQAQLAAVAAVKSAEAAVAAAELNLGFTQVTSLVDGVAAIATAQMGDLVGPQTLLTTVSQVDPIKAYFPISEQEYLQMSSAGGRNRGKGPFGGDVPLSLILADGSTFPRPGRFLAADREIDPKTGTIRIAATFPNPERLLRPGQYGRVQAQTETLTSAFLVPQRAVNEMQGTYQVRTVGTDDKVMLKPVKVGPRVGARWVITEGLAEGARVIVEGPPTPDGTVVNARPFTPPPTTETR